jgi:hypothetical protein
VKVFGEILKIKLKQTSYQFSYQFKSKILSRVPVASASKLPQISHVNRCLHGTSNSNCSFTLFTANVSPRQSLQESLLGENLILMNFQRQVPLQRQAQMNDSFRQSDSTIKIVN